MHRSGWDASVAEIVHANNLVYVSDIEEGPLLSWVLQSGLTQEEAALIQPAYGGGTPHVEATWSALQVPDADVNCCGVTVSDVQVNYLRFDADADMPEQAFAAARDLVDAQGISYPTSQFLSFAVGDTEHNGSHQGFGFERLWENNLDDWVATKRHGAIVHGGLEQNTAITKTQFTVHLDELTRAIGVTTAGDSGLGFGNSTLALEGGHVIVLSEVRSLTGDLIGESGLYFDENTPTGMGLRSPLIPVDGDEFIVTTYGMAIGYAYFGDVAVEFSRVPEPTSNWLGLIVACVLVRRRRV